MPCLIFTDSFILATPANPQTQTEKTAVQLSFGTVRAVDENINTRNPLYDRYCIHFWAIESLKLTEAICIQEKWSIT